MGQRSSTETLIGIFAAFFRERTWSQAELARVVGVAPRVVHRVLDELVLAGWPFEVERDHPQIYWSLPRGYLPGGVLLKPEQVNLLLRVVARSPQSRERAELVAAIGSGLPGPAAVLLERLVPSRMSSGEAQVLPIVEDALRGRQALRVRYYTASRGALTHRLVSVQRVLLGPPARCVVYCAEAKALRWFRLESMVEAKLAPEGRFVEVGQAEVDAFVCRSVDGFSEGKVLRVAFWVREPEARWVAGNLPVGLEGKEGAKGLWVEAETAGLRTIARFVAGLGEAAEVETPELAQAVRELAQGALRSLEKKGHTFSGT